MNHGQRVSLMGRRLITMGTMDTMITMQSKVHRAHRAIVVIVTQRPWLVSRLG
jgi:hypothetical protein